MKFYVYELRDPASVVFYVGKGQGNRINSHEPRARRGDMSHRSCKIRKIWSVGGTVSKVVVFETNDECAALSEEIRLIALYGRDSLTNKTDGGDGVSNPSQEAREKIAKGRRGCKAGSETRQRQREAKLGKPRSAETKAKISKFQRGSKHPWATSIARQNLQRGMSFQGRKHSPETLAKMRAAKLGHSVSEETKRKISETKRRKNNVPSNL